MKILVVCQYYSPEPFRISDICEELVKRGHEVLVVTGVPNYPEGRIYKGYRFGKNRNENINGVRIHRCFTIARRSGALFRLLNYYSYSFSSALYTSLLNERFDVVFVNQLSPIIMTRAAITYKNKHRTRMVLYCLDLWPESLAVGGVKKGSALYRFFHRVSRRMYAKPDQILVSSKDFSTYFKEEFGITNTLYLPQYAETVFSPECCKKEPNQTIDVMFAGNIGAAQSVDTIIYAAHKTRDIPSLYWHIVGEGSELTHIQELCRSLELLNVIFHGRQPLESMPKYYAMADAMLVTMQKDDGISKTLPGKVQTYMAAGKPILGAVGGEAAEIITDAKCGMCCPAEDANGLARIVRDFAKHIATQRYGECALEYYHRSFSKNRIIEDLIKSFRDNGDKE